MLAVPRMVSPNSNSLTTFPSSPVRSTTCPTPSSLKRYRWPFSAATGEAEGRDCWIIDFKPLAATPGRGLHQGTVWVDREIYARVRTRAVQLGLEGDVISNEETMTFSPLDAAGRPAPWSRDSFYLPLRVVGQQLLSILNATVPIETETELSDVRINPDDFDAEREAAYASELAKRWWSPPSRVEINE